MDLGAIVKIKAATVTLGGIARNGSVVQVDFSSVVIAVNAATVAVLGAVPRDGSAIVKVYVSARGVVIDSAAIIGSVAVDFALVDGDCARACVHKDAAAVVVCVVGADLAVGAVNQDFGFRLIDVDSATIVFGGVVEDQATVCIAVALKGDLGSYSRHSNSAAVARRSVGVNEAAVLHRDAAIPAGNGNAGAVSLAVVLRDVAVVHYELGFGALQGDSAAVARYVVAGGKEARIGHVAGNGDVV